LIVLEELDVIADVVDPLLIIVVDFWVLDRYLIFKVLHKLVSISLRH